MLADIVAGYIRENVAIFVVTLLLTVAVVPVDAVLLPWAYGLLLTALKDGHGLSWAVAWVVGGLAVYQLGYCVIDLLEANIQPGLFEYVREKLLESLYEKYEGNYEDLSHGHIISKIVRCPQIMIWWTAMAMEVIIPTLTAIIASIIYLSFHDAVITATFAIYVGSVSTLLAVTPFKCSSKSAIRERSLDQVSDSIDDVLSNLQSVYTNGTFHQESDAIKELSRAFVKSHKCIINCVISSKTTITPITCVFTAVVVYRGIELVKTGRMSLGTFASIFMVSMAAIRSLMTVIFSIKDISADAGTVMETTAVFSQIFHKTNIFPLHLPLTATPNASGIGAFHLTCSSRGRTLISDVSVDFPLGQRSMLVGPVGSGKSTLLRALIGLITPESGDLYIGNAWYSDLSSPSSARRIAYMPQVPILFDRSVVDNVLYGAAHGKSTSDVENLAKRIGFTIPLDVPVGKQGSSLSGGQRQLVWFMRMLMKEPEVILMDEPTSSMDVASKNIMINALRVIDPRTTIIIVTHDPDVARFTHNHIHMPH